ncbi:hypothetical protein ALC56_07140, partial [Trachymyrmex septentrionalis]
HQELHGNDFQNRVQFCEWALQRLQEDNMFVTKILFTDEATFTNNRQTNLRNMHIKNLLFDIKLRNCSAIMHALITDMSLRISPQNSTFLVNSGRVVYIFDTPYLIKAARNNLLKYNFKINNKIASCDYIVQFYNRNST